jgi:hypothetical protein
MYNFKKVKGDWRNWSTRKDCLAVDFHWNVFGKREKDYGSCMADVYETAKNGLIQAQSENYNYVLFTHGSSTSRPGQTTARSTVRKLMQSKESTPYIVKKDCLQCETVFIASIRKLKS